jgi:RND family efflux transporter MFP subunit
LLAIASWSLVQGDWLGTEPASAFEGVPVRRGDLLISESAHGNLEAKDSLRMVCELEGRASIIFLAEEGTIVQEGQLVCELDVSDLRDRRVTQEISVKNGEASFTKAREQYDIQEIQNTSDIAESKLALELAGMDLAKYTQPDGEWEHELAQAEEAIKLAEEELKQAEETLRWTTQLADKGFVQRTELERDELSLERARIKLEQSQREKRLKETFERPRRLAELNSDVATREREVLKTEKQARARLADYEAARDSAEFMLEREREKLAKYTDQIGKAKILAPGTGMLVYSRTRGSSWRGGGEVPEEGKDVYERQEIATIPRAGGMTAIASLHETKLENVRVGQSCSVTIDAIPGQVFVGEVAFLAAVADSGSWMSNPNQRLYKTEVTIEDGVPEMRPGMSCNIEVIIDQLSAVLYIPRQSAHLDGSETIAFVVTDGAVEQRVIGVGQDNSKWVEITSGLAEGELVTLSPPASWEPSATAPAPSTGPQGKGPPSRNSAQAPGSDSSRGPNKAGSRGPAGKQDGPRATTPAPSSTREASHGQGTSRSAPAGAKRSPGQALSKSRAE